MAVRYATHIASPICASFSVSALSPSNTMFRPHITTPIDSTETTFYTTSGHSTSGLLTDPFLKRRLCWTTKCGFSSTASSTISQRHASCVCIATVPVCYPEQNEDLPPTEWRVIPMSLKHGSKIDRCRKLLLLYNRVSKNIRRGNHSPPVRWLQFAS